MSLAEDLRAAFAFIDTPEKWTQGAAARDADGVDVPSVAPRAVCWCSVGAISAVPGLGSRWFYVEEALAASNDVALGCIPDWNDANPYEVVRAGWQKAIADAEAAEATA